MRPFFHFFHAASAVLPTCSVSIFQCVLFVQAFVSAELLFYPQYLICFTFYHNFTGVMLELHLLQ